jgi:putative holliday junction resolvase
MAAHERCDRFGFGCRGGTNWRGGLRYKWAFCLSTWFYRAPLDIAAIKAQMTKEQAQTVVVGLPLKTDGSYSGQTQRVRAFAKDLERAGIQVELQDERFSTKLAQSQLLVTSNKRDRLEKGLLDAQSAVLILETYLARQAATIPKTSTET